MRKSVRRVRVRPVRVAVSVAAPFAIVAKLAN